MNIASVKSTKHKWSDPVPVDAANSPAGYEQSERQCALCDLIKITVHPPEGFAYRAWRYRNTSEQFSAPRTPLCKGGS